ncbi:MAG: aldehyde dehydrogenase family protein, partial [Candidatus Omnitrophica bacterium]|nr:aldehyde dehydrogenase family protein [Candidatus Omnitrophota bacterium]
MKKFTLLVGGKDLDTGIYEYFPYADKYISDFKTTFRILTQLKLGKISEESPQVNGYIFAKYCINEEDTNLKAIEAAYKASKEYRYFSVARRKKIFKDIISLLKKYRKEVVDLLIIEGHPKKLAEWETEGMLRGGEDATINFYKQQIMKKVGKENEENLYLIRKPDGVLCVVPPRNAPVSNSIIAVSALFAGNCLIIKPPLKNPLSTIYVWKDIVYKAAIDNGAPKGVINIV